MKKIVFAIAMLLFFWNQQCAAKDYLVLSAKKLANNKYEVHITATPPGVAYLFPAYTGWRTCSYHI